VSDWSADDMKEWLLTIGAMVVWLASAAFLLLGALRLLQQFVAALR
jgi:hypothetical protein